MRPYILRGDEMGRERGEECSRTCAAQGGSSAAPLNVMGSSQGGNDCVRAPLNDDKGERGGGRWGQLKNDHLARATYGTTPLSLKSPLC